MESHHQIVYCHTQDIRWGSLTPLQKGNQCISQLQPTGFCLNDLFYYHGNPSDVILCFVVSLLFGILWHINLCRLFNVKSIFMKLVLFQTIQFRISTQFKCKYSLCETKNISITSYWVEPSSSISANSVWY